MILDKTKAYDLRDLSLEQLKKLYKINNFSYTFEQFVGYSINHAYAYVDGEWNFTKIRYPYYTNALELFDDKGNIIQELIDLLVVNHGYTLEQPLIKKALEYVKGES